MNGTLVSRFTEIVSRYPHREAICGADATLTYHELDAQASRIASGILAHRGNSAEPIGILLPQSAALCAAIMGVLKAGKFYVPMDPSHPAARNAQVQADAGFHLIVDAPTLVELLAHPAGSDLPTVSPDRFAYIYYTSGSTGRPKGVVDTHRNVLHNIHRYTINLEITADDRLTLLQGPAFSGAVSSLFCALLNGATVCPYDAQQHGVDRHLADWVRDNRITIYHSVPAIFRSMVASGGQFPSVRIIRLEGDAASRLDVQLFRAHFDRQCRLAHGLGATETGLTRQLMADHDTPLPEGMLPLGFATADMRTLILSEDGSPCPPGTIGEIAIQSRYLATGYWNQPDLTRTAFTPSPEGVDRIYHSGDLGRLDSNGCLEYLGRRNAGFKVNGNRVEPAEVEQALLSLDGVREAAVAGHPVNGQLRLVAYLVASNGSLPAPFRLRELLRAILPEYLIPSRFVTLEQLPTGQNGKVDRRLLPWPPPANPQHGSWYVAPRDELEQRLVSLWEEILQTDPVGVQDDFFDLGGDSLCAGRLVPAVEEIAGRSLIVTTILTAPTIERLAAVIRNGQPEHDPVLVPIAVRADSRPVFCIPEHNGRLGVGLAALGRQLGEQWPFYALQAVGVAGDEPPLPTISAMARRYGLAIRSVQPHGPYTLAGRCFGAVVALELAHQLAEAGEQVDPLCFIDVTPEDFPGLVPDQVRRRFRNHRWSQKLRDELFNIRGRKLWKRGPYLIREMGRVLLNQTRARRMQSRLVRGEIRPGTQWDVGGISREAFARHRSRPWPGRIVLFLREQDRLRYGPNPTEVWRDLAIAGCPLHYLSGSPQQFRQPDQTQEVADLLRAILGKTR